VIIKSNLTATSLPVYLDERSIARSQIVTITEPEPGYFTLIYEATDTQQDLHNEEMRKLGEAYGKFFK
jgi:hypothetical protein